MHAHSTNMHLLKARLEDCIIVIFKGVGKHTDFLAIFPKST